MGATDTQIRILVSTEEDNLSPFDSKSLPCGRAAKLKQQVYMYVCPWFHQKNMTRFFSILSTSRGFISPKISQYAHSPPARPRYEVSFEGLSSDYSWSSSLCVLFDVVSCMTAIYRKLTVLTSTIYMFRICGSSLQYTCTCLSDFMFKSKWFVW